MIFSLQKEKLSADRERQLKYLSQAVQLEEAVNPRLVRSTMTAISLALIAFVCWAGVTTVDEVARTPGEVVPHGYQQVVQHFEGGMVGEILVRDGDVVEAGQVLLVLTNGGVREDLERVASKHLSLSLQIERLRAFLEDRELDFSALEGIDADLVAEQKNFFDDMKQATHNDQEIIRKQIAQKQQSLKSLETDLVMARENLAIAQEMFRRKQGLNDKGYVSDMQILEEKRRVNELRGRIQGLENKIVVATTESEEFEDRLQSLAARNRDELNNRLDAILNERAQNGELIDKLQERIARMTVRAPTKGLVKGLSINTVGAVVQPGQALMELVPLGQSLDVEIEISPDDIGHIRVGQNVQVKVSTFDFSQHGVVAGRLDHISATTFSSGDGTPFYRGRVALAQTYVGNNPDNELLPGMTVLADIITGEKSILQYLLKPIHRSMATAFTER